MEDLAMRIFNLTDYLSKLQDSHAWKELTLLADTLPLSEPDNVSVSLDGIRPYSGAVIADELWENLEKLRTLSNTLCGRLDPDKDDGTVAIIGTDKVMNF